MSKKETLWNRHYVMVLTINILNAFSFYMISNILSSYLVDIGISIALAGFVVGLFSLTSLCFRPFSGLMSDRLNNVTLLKWSNVLLGIGLLGFTVVTRLPLIILFRIINGIGFAIGGTVQISLASKYIPDGRMGEGIGYLGLGMVAGSAVAPGIGLAISDYVGMRATFLLAAALAAAAFVILCLFKEDAAPKRDLVKKEKKKIRLNDIIAPKALPFTVMAGSYSLINGIIASYLVLYTQELGISQISIYFTVCAAALFLMRPLSGKLMDKKGIRITVIPGMLLTAGSMFILGRVGTLPLVLLTGVIRSLGQGAAQPSLQAGCIQRVGLKQSGVATSTYYLGGDICQGLGPMAGGLIVGHIAGLAGYRVVFDLCGIIMLCALVYFIFYTRKRNGD